MQNPFQKEAPPILYVSLPQTPEPRRDVAVRVHGDPLHLAPAVTLSVRAVDPEQPITDMMTMEKLIHHRTLGMSYMAVLMGVFGLLALVLSSIGVYGVMAYLVAEQTHEIGVRMALGALRRNVLALVFRGAMVTIAAGLAVGLPLAYGLAEILKSMFFGVAATDAITFLGTPLVLVAAAALAIYVPARRAMKIDPIVALRYE